MKDLYSENYKKEVEDDTNKWNDILCSWVGRINTVKKPILPKANYRFSVTPIKIPMAFFTELEQTILKYVMEQQKTSNIQSNLEKEEQSWRYHTL